MTDDPATTGRRHPRGLSATIRADHEATGGRYLLADVEGRRGARVPLHVHDCEDEWLLVLEGELLVTTLDGERRVGPAEPAVLARREPHEIAVASEHARFLTMWDPAGPEDAEHLLAGLTLV